MQEHRPQSSEQEQSQLVTIALSSAPRPEDLELERRLLPLLVELEDPRLDDSDTDARPSLQKLRDLYNQSMDAKHLGRQVTLNNTMCARLCEDLISFCGKKTGSLVHPRLTEDALVSLQLLLDMLVDGTLIALPGTHEPLACSDRIVPGLVRQ